MNSASIVALIAAAISFATAVIFVLRQRQTLADWLFIAGAVAIGTERLFSGLLFSASTFGTVEHWARVRLVSLGVVGGLWLAFSLVYGRANGAAFLRRWRSRVIALAAVPSAAALAFSRDLIQAVPAARGSLVWQLDLGWAGLIVLIAFVISAVLIVLNLERTYRLSAGVFLWRIKFMLLGVGLLWAVRIYTTSQVILFGHAGVTPDLIDSVAASVALATTLPSLMRRGSTEIGVYPSQSILQGSVTVLLAGLYLLSVGVIAKLAPLAGGDSAIAIKIVSVVIALVLLAALLQSDRARLHVRQFVSRHFNRPLYDYRAVWRRFTEGTSSKVDPNDLCASLARLVADTFAALSVTIWLVEDSSGELVFATSTSLTADTVREQKPTPTESKAVAEFFRDHTDPLDIEEINAPWACALRRWTPRQFGKSGHRVCVPLLGRGRLLGVISIADRVRSVPFTVQDYDMLKCAADHASANLLNLELSRQLLAAKQLEAFQTMAAFFVHDLKNAASTLNLMLQNLPVHFDDPAFRQDALRGIGKTVAHINRVIGQLGLLRHDLKINPEERDLNQLVIKTLNELRLSSAATITKELGSVAKTLLDEEQFGKVVTNLVLNATEAIQSNGTVRVATHQNDGWIMLTVADDGCGMSDDFIRRSLFRPFQTTKRQGLGIGMFQSRMIVEAHGGRMNVTSAIGKGSTFEILLPVRSKTP